MAYTNSKLVDYKRISPNRNRNRNHKIDTITIHCVVGQCSVQTLGSIFAAPSKAASSNYGVGYDGKIGLYVEEKDRSWCSSSAANDNRAVTIEVASDTRHPYAVNARAYAALIDLVTDICRRNGIKKLVWSTSKTKRVNHKNGCNMTVHRDYANKACPGKYLYDRMGKIAAEVNKRLGKSTASKPAEPAKKPAASEPAASAKKPATSKMSYKVGNNYMLQANMKVRTGAGTNYPQKKRSQLTADGKKHSLNQNAAVLLAGTVITCMAVSKDGNWIKCPSGWICGKDGSTIYVK